MFFFVFNSYEDQANYPLNSFSPPYYQGSYVYEPMLIQSPEFYHLNQVEMEQNQN